MKRNCHKKNHLKYTVCVWMFVSSIVLFSTCTFRSSQDTTEDDEDEIEAQDERKTGALLAINKEQEQKALSDRYKDHSLRTGATPYSLFYGENQTCTDYGWTSNPPVTKFLI